MPILLDARHVCNSHHEQDNTRHDALEAARQMAGDPRSYRVSPRRPCPICGGRKWCLHDPLSGVCLCPRQADGALTNNSGQPFRFGEFGFVHVHGSGSIYAGGPPPRRLPASKAATSPESLSRQAAIDSQRAATLLSAAAAELGLPVAALAAFGLGADPRFWFPDSGQQASAWTWREYDAQGHVAGIGGRRRGGGEKGFRKGGRRGIILAAVHAADREKLRTDILARGRVVLPEGFSDSVATHAMGEVAIGRPSVSGGIDQAAALLLALNLPTAIEVVLCGENDQDAAGHWPGRDQAIETARKLEGLLHGRHRVTVLLPPAGTKDIRAAWISGVRTWDEYSRRAIPCGYLADCCSCPDSCVHENGTVRTNRDKATIPQYIRNQSARYSTNPWDCPNAFGVAGEVRHSPVLIPATCRRRDCPVCGPRWRQVTFERFGYHIDQHDGELFTDCVLDVDWAATVKAMRREAKARGMPLKFVAVRDEEDCLTLISSVASSPYAKQIDKMAAIETLQRAVDAADLAPRPVSCCRSWGRIDSDSGPEEKAQRVPGGATPTAFRETLKAWGADAVDRGSVIRCAVDNLFLDKATGQTDGEMQADFWREAELYTACGPEAAVEFRKRVAKRRQSSRVERPPGAADCFHDWVDTNNGDGRTKRTCRLCGEFYGYMQEAQQ